MKGGKRKSRIIMVGALVALSAGALVLGACSPRVFGPMGPVTEARWLSLTESSYMAADILAQEAGPELDTTRPLVVATLSDINQIETSSALGRMIAEQVGARFSQLGYTVTEVKLREDINVRQRSQSTDQSGEFLLSRNSEALKEAAGAGSIVTGTYAVAQDSILVNLRLIRAGDSKVIAAHDYSLVMTPDIAALARTDSQEREFRFFGGGWATE